MAEQEAIEFYNAFITQAELDYQKVIDKINECHNTLKDKSSYKYELEMKIRQCCAKELEGFHERWFYSSDESIKKAPAHYYQAGNKTFLMYLELIKYIKNVCDND